MKLSDFLEEAAIMKEMKHPNLVQVRGSVASECVMFWTTGNCFSLQSALYFSFLAYAQGSRLFTSSPSLCREGTCWTISAQPTGSQSGSFKSPVYIRLFIRNEINEVVLMYVATQIASGMSYLELKNFMQNIFSKI